MVGDQTSLSFETVIDTLVQRQDLCADQASFAMEQILLGQASDVHIAALITLMRSKPETATELAAIVQTMWDHCPDYGNVDVASAIDTCGTGGDNSRTINISTAASLVVSACGVPVAKHGNKAASSKCGAADVLEELGIVTTLSPTQAAELFSSTGFAFLFAPTFHAGMRFAAPVRSELGVRTTFNFLGPLANPFRVPFRLHGVSDPDLVPTYAETLIDLGITRGFVFHGHGGLDEISLSGTTTGLLIDEGKMRDLSIDPTAWGREIAQTSELVGDNAAYNAQIIRDIFEGSADRAYRDVVVLNAAVALHIATRSEPDHCVEQVEQALSRGRVSEQMNKVIEMSRALAQ